MTDKSLQDTVAIELRFVFVEMLFALAIAEVATQVATIAIEPLIREATSSYTHLLLATILIAASWIGWKNSAAKGNKLPVNEVFGLGFLVLLLDLALVVVYFIIAKGAEKPVKGVVTPSAVNETDWILIVFIGYFAWDVLTKAVPHVENTTFMKRLLGKELWERGWKTLLCVVLALLIWFLVRNVSTKEGVVMVDISLISLVLLFRAVKEWTKGKTIVWIVLCSVVLVASLAGASCAGIRQQPPESVGRDQGFLH